MNNFYEMLNPWADADPVPLTGISPQLESLEDMTIGLFAGYKLASEPILAEVEKGLKERFPSVNVNHYRCDQHVDIQDYKNRAELENWLDGLDAVISAVGD